MILDSESSVLLIRQQGEQDLILPWPKLPGMDNNSFAKFNSR